MWLADRYRHCLNCFSVGGSPSSKQMLQGKIADFQMWDRALSDKEVRRKRKSCHLWQPWHRWYRKAPAGRKLYMHTDIKRWCSCSNHRASIAGIISVQKPSIQMVMSYCSPPLMRDDQICWPMLQNQLCYHLWSKTIQFVISTSMVCKQY